MRKWLLNVHIYGTLLCSSYLIIFGFSSLHFNHHAAEGAPPEVKVTWEQSLPTPAVKDKQAEADAVRDALGLMGWTIPWKMKQDAQGNLTFELERPGKSYTIQVLPQAGKARVEERHKGFLTVVNSLHALMALPNSRFVNYWGYYTELCTWVVLAAAGSGLYLWATSKRRNRAGALTLGAAVTVSLSLIAYVILHG